MKISLITICTFLTATQVFANLNFTKDFSLKNVDLYELSTTLTDDIFNQKKWPTSVNVDEQDLSVKYTFNQKLTKYVKRELRRYRSDFASVVIIDNNTGKILTAVDYTRQSKAFGKSLTFSSTNPAASVFKVVTAAELLENTDVGKNSLFSFNGKSSTLYKYQLKPRKKNRWTRTIPFKSAFAFSNNVIFGKAAIENTSHEGITKMAQRFGFNKSLTQLVNVGNSRLLEDEGEYRLAEYASGFNRKTNISPLHGAVIASVIANDGVLLKPTMIEEVKNTDQDRIIWKNNRIYQRVLTKDTNDELRSLMELTVKRGTARGAFRPWKMKRIKNIKVGGKTGTITGGFPHGKRDWFVSYAQPKTGKDKGISVSIMIVNVKKWYIKSTYLAKNIIEYYYSRVNKN